MPESKRYADTQNEELLLLDRQNQIITDCFGLDTSIYLVTGNYFTLDYFQPEYDRRKIISYNLIEAPSINLHQTDPEYFDDGDENDGCFMPLYTQVIWEPKKHDDLLLKIANDEIKAFLISFEKNIIVAPYESDSIVPVLEKANTLGIPVIIVDRKVKTSNYTAFIGADNIEVGKIAGKQIVSLSKGKANIIEIRGESITSPGTERSLGFKKIIDQYPNIKSSSVDYDDFNSPNSKYLNLLIL